MKMNFLKYMLLTLVLILAGVPVQAEKNRHMVEIRVQDENERPIEGARVASDKLLFYTDYQGRCFVNPAKVTTVDVSAVGFISRKAKVEKTGNVVIKLSSSNAAGMGEEWIDNGFYKMKNAAALASVSHLDVAGRIRENNRSSIGDYINGMLGGLAVGNNVRGLGTPLFVVDGVPGRDISNIDPREVDDVTFLRDANAVALYGSKGTNGVVLIRTKRGLQQKNEITVSAGYGMFIPKSFPEYLNAADYMTLYNEARANDGIMEPLYSEELIENTRSGINPYQYPDVDFYSSDYLRPFRSEADASVEFRGGNSNLKYYVSMRYGFANSLEKINYENDKPANRFDVRANLDAKINKWISSTVDVNVYVRQDKNSFSGLLANAGKFRSNLYCPLIPVEYISEDLLNSELMKSVKLYNGFVLGGSSSYKDIKPFASMFGQGYTKAVDRNTEVSNTIDFDLGMITEGLYARTTFGFDYYDRYSVKLENKFNFYEPVWFDNMVIDLIPLGVPDSKAVEEQVGVRDFLLRYGGSVQFGYNRTFKDAHTVNAVMVAYTFSQKLRDVKQTHVDSHLGFDLSYDYKNRYYVDFTGAVMHSIKLASGHRAAFSPAVSLGWVISNEEFMKTASAVDFLRLRASYANLASDTDINRYFLYQDVVNVQTSPYTWADGEMYQFRTVFLNGGNRFLEPIRNKEFTVGVDAEFFKSLRFSADYFLLDRTNFIRQDLVSYPDFYGQFVPYINDGVNRYQGLELAVQYGHSFGDFSIDAGLNFNYSEGVVKERKEINLEYDYLSSIGTKIGSIRGLVAEGLYQMDDFNLDGSLADGLVESSFGKIQAGDIKYRNLNGDDVIDALDEKVIGCSHSPYSLALNLTLKYRDFSLFVLGRGLFGGQAMLDHGSYYWADGNDKYSSIVLDRWTPETADTATYPRLTSGVATNNYRKSTFWLYDKSFFDLAKIQLTYSLPVRYCNRIGFNSMDFSITGMNLLKIAPERKILELGINNPQFRGVLFGVRFGL